METHPETQSIQQIKERIFTPLDEAVEIIKERRKDKELKHKIELFLDNNIPEHFSYSSPILYLSRHLLTPNYEALRFIEITKDKDLPRVIGVDKHDKFISKNPLKRALGKMSVTKGTARNGDEIVENFTIMDFERFDGATLENIKTVFNQPLQEFHHDLFHEIYPNSVLIGDESIWVDQNYRGELREQYIRMLALLCVHGVMFESYIEKEHELLTECVIPAFEKIENLFNVKPLIVELVDEDLEDTKNWNGYPSVLYKHIKQKFNTR